MDKQSILAMVLIALIIILYPTYHRWIQGDQPVEQQQQINRDTVKTQPAEAQQEKAPESITKPEKQFVEKKQVLDEPVDEEVSENQLQVVQDSTERLIRINTPKIHAVLSNRGGGSLQKFVLKKYNKYDSTLVDMIDPQINNDIDLTFQDDDGNFIEPDNYLFSTNEPRRRINLNPGDRYEISYSLEIDGNTLTKTFIFYEKFYHFDLVIRFSNPGDMLLNGQYQIGWKNGLPSTESYVQDDYTYSQAYVYMGDELESYAVDEEGKKERVNISGNASWMAIRTKYFITSLINKNANVSSGIYFAGEGIKKEDYIQRLYDMGYYARYENVQSGDSVRIYMGPLDHTELNRYENELDILIMNNGWYERLFRFFSLIILQILEFLHSFIPNYGVVIIVFSILIKLLLHPLTRKSYTSMKQMQKIQPLMTEIREKYKNDAQRMNKEMMKLYKEHGVNPLGGCLPMLLQMPLLFALFIVFRSTIQLRGAMFIPGWIDDLSRTEGLFTLPFSLPFYGNEFNLLPVLMAVTMIFQSKMTMQDPKQKAMVYIMPVFMLLIFNRFPSGLNLYYTLFNLLTIIQQKFTGQGKPSEPPADKKVKKR